jgi:hypothetical protein
MADCKGTLVNHYFDPYYNNPVWHEIVQNLREEARRPPDDSDIGYEPDRDE